MSVRNSRHGYLLKPYFRKDPVLALQFTSMPCPRAKEKPQQDSRRGKIAFRIKPLTHQRCSEGSNKPCVHQDPETTESEPELCLSVSCEGMGQQWPAAGAEALGPADLGMA